MTSRRDFDWDEAKALGNIAKHGVPFPYAIRVFLDAAMVDFDASRTEDGEVRRKAVGMIEGRLFTLVYAEREGVIRVISARRSNGKEERHYGPV